MFTFNQENEICAICLDKKRFPVFLICGHSFCKPCITVYMTYEDICTKCPLCRNKLTRKKRLSSWYWIGVLGILILGIASGVVFHCNYELK